jgi:hypothetical protein
VRRLGSRTRLPNCAGRASASSHPAGARSNLTSDCAIPMRLSTLEFPELRPVDLDLLSISAETELTSGVTPANIKHVFQTDVLVL